ncbi:MAG TPA: MerR family DNA-binding transcriptional regulator [Serratia grimesii]|jgi:DNA-binding transcriptional MerR regulator|uniref:MerR family DNA-binding transcriptional regulator n=1 Tax=Serratia grimesii TaxID=82995 RepID=A0A9C7QX38_9GAMM|nr:MerR family transcriptional regulator [Serratia grimesii]CAI0792285.1 HTH-type transcriptional activator tipA [Serratia grimesii]CAI1504343.1 HTH-type transcriptional activator tipA [Serratia grimesii]CAI2461947.1 HTH-type transcriptional activator tipA [Serratia grimesii]CAI2786141.1 HTH-type transcriptional activator tipA [Serratia grimesii]SUI32078.1 HTH-type transcriptional activator tipA [Serratia grimesii]
MLLKVGELARRSGITVRTLHYYDSIGLLVPSARSDAGYRLYNRADITRLHHIQALRRMGVTLDEIGAILARSGMALTTVIEQQITMLNRQLVQTAALRDRLQQMHAQLSIGDEPELNDWLTTLELMTMYDKYFTADELAQLPFYQASPTRNREWGELVSGIRTLIENGIEPQAQQAQDLSRRWMQMLERDTANNPAFLTRLNTMHADEPSIREQTGITPTMTDYVTRAFAETKLSIYQKYLSEEEYAYVRQHYFTRLQEWPALIAQFHQALNEGVPPESEQAKSLAAQWLELFQSYAGTNPATQMKIRQAMEREPTLVEGTWLTPPLLRYLQQAVAQLMRG